MRIDKRFLNWGVFLILLGAIPLAVQQGAISAETVADWWRLWPLIIIGLGIGVLLSRTQAAFLGGLTIAATLGIMLGSLIATGGDFAGLGDIACGGDRSTTAYAEQRGEFASQAATVRLDMNCGDVTVGTGAGSGWTVAGRASDGQAPLVEATAERLVVRSRDGDRRDGFFGFGREREDWTVTVPTAVTTFGATLNAGLSRIDLSESAVSDASLDANAADVRIDLTGAPIRSLDAGVNAGSLRVGLPAETFRATLRANAGSVGFCVPAGVAVRVHTKDNITAGNNFDERGLVKSGSTWETPGYDGAQTRIEIDANVNAGSIDMNPEDGCR